MIHISSKLTGSFVTCIFTLLILEATPAWSEETRALTDLYWCPERVGKEVQLASGQGCQRLIENERPTASGKSNARTSIKLDNIENAVGSFLLRYREFLACCAANLESDDQIKELETEASDLLRQTVSQIPPAFFFALRNQALIVPVAKARDQLRTLIKRLDKIRPLEENLSTLDYEAAGRESREIRELKESIRKDFQPQKELPRAPTGVEIGVTGPTGSVIGTTQPTGTNIGQPAQPANDIGFRPSTPREQINTPLEQQPGSSLAPTVPYSSGTFGPDIGSSSLPSTTGPGFGDSTLNRTP